MSSFALGALIAASCGRAPDRNTLHPRATAEAGTEPRSLDVESYEPASSNATLLENLRTGTTAWQLSLPAMAHEIEGYASRTSVNLGEPLAFFVRTNEPGFDLEIFRLGWYAGKGGRLMLPRVLLKSVAQPTPVVDTTTGLLECSWKKSYLLFIPPDWTSGVYLAKLTTSISRREQYIIFVVRDDSRHSDVFFKVAFATYQAYNNWGGKSVYASNSTANDPARKVSFNRPFADGFGAGRFFTYEIDMLRFLERNGYDVTYCTNIDVHDDIKLSLTHRALISVGHDEYWSFAERRHTEIARDRGVSLGFFGANAVYWQVRYEPSTLNAVPHRTLVAYKSFAVREDPYYQQAATRPYSTIRFRDLGRPEDALIGVMYNAVWPVDTDLEVKDASSWVYAGTGLRAGDRIPGLVGYEVDEIFGDQPANTILLARTLVVGRNMNQGFSDMTVYTADSGATVFATGTQQWSWGLDAFDPPWQPDHGRATRESSDVAQRITSNVLSQFIDRSN
jgi:hypothetical protein